MRSSPRATRDGWSEAWPHRLTVRTPGSQPGNRGSIPRGATIIFEHQKCSI